MQDKKNTIEFNQNQGIQNEFRCDNIFKASHKQPYADTTQAGKWGKGNDDSPVNEDEHPDINNPLAALIDFLYRLYTSFCKYLQMGVYFFALKIFFLKST